MKKWNIKIPERETAVSLSQGCEMSLLTASVLASKGYSSPQSVAEKLNQSELSDPFLMKDMAEAVNTINSAIDSGDRICVYGDYDCDGIVSTVILYSYLMEAGADVIYYIPERSEGYGLNRNAVEQIADNGVKLIVTVDNGISAIDEAEYIYQLGMKLVVTDHHQQGESLPRAEAVVDAHRHDCFSPFKYMCGAGIAVKLISALDGGNYTLALEQFGDLASIATVADIVSLTGENRFLVQYGLERINNTDRPALKALIDACGLNGKTLDSYSIGFGLAPRINASGRFGSPKTAVEMFLCEEYSDALPLAEQLNDLNNKRKSAEREIEDEIYAMIDSDPSIIWNRTICICGKNWHHGVIGIVASRIMEIFGKPCYIASESNGEIRGSARSFGEFSVFQSLVSASESLEKFGGHLGAGGFTVKNGEFESFRMLIEKYALENYSQMPVYSVTADCPVQPSELTIENAKNLSLLEPFGAENEKPLFFIGNAQIVDIFPLSEGVHSKLRIKYGSLIADALVFRTPPESLTVKKGDMCDLIVSIGVNEFNGRTSVSIVVSDYRLHGFAQSRFFSGLSTFETFMRGEELPQNYYESMLPTHDDTAKLYKCIPDGGVSIERLCIMLSHAGINYAKSRIATEALRQLGLVEISSKNLCVKRVKPNGKTELASAPVLIKLAEKIM